MTTTPSSPRIPYDNRDPKDIALELFEIIVSSETPQQIAYRISSELQYPHNYVAIMQYEAMSVIYSVVLEHPRGRIFV